jgi:hypothetical protein
MKHCVGATKNFEVSSDSRRVTVIKLYRYGKINDHVWLAYGNNINSYNPAFNTYNILN